MYPPRFDLRHFIAHLAPGGYYFLQLSLLAIFIFWLFYPETLANLGVKLNDVNKLLLTFGFLITGVLCYFIGVVLRFSSVNEVDDISAEINLRNELKKLTSKANLLKKLAISQWLKKLAISQWVYLLVQLVWETQYFTCTCKQVYKVLKSQKNEEEKFVQLICSLNKKNKEDSDEYFRDWLKEIAAENLEEARKQPIFLERAIEKFLKESERKWVISWLWAADSFPYPLWLSYKTYLHAIPESHREFEQKLWPVLLETMGGEVAEITRTQVPPRIARREPSFNRCKLFVMTRSLDLASDVYDREALICMMAGFYRGLRLGSRVALLTLILSAVLLGAKQLGIFEWRFNPCLNGIGYMVLIFIFSLLFNGSLLIKVVDNFRMIRMSESDAVFASYLIALSLKSKQA